MKKSLSFAILGLFLSSPAFAYLSSSAVTTMSLPVYGIYTSSDATCTTGLTATVPLTKTAQSINFAAAPTIGSGSISTTINCVIMVIGNSLSNGWAAGSYTTTSQSYNDSNCNAGGSTTGQTICGSGGTPQTITWPTQITTDAASVGLTLTTSSCSGSTSEIVPLVLSTNSVCTGQSVADSTVSACSGGNINNFTLPTTTSDATHGTKLTAPSVTTGNFKFIVNPSNTLGGQNGGTCGNIAAPLFSFAAS